MEFHSVRFGVFLVVVLGLFWASARRRGLRGLVLLVASYVFYGAFGPWMLALLAFSTVLDYVAGARIAAAADRRAKRAWLGASLAGNLGLLAYFKYSGWMAEGWSALGVTLGLDPEIAAGWAWRAAVPVGISFYTFQTLSYTIDVYRGTLRPARTFAEFALFVAFFPQLVAGPIVRAADFLPQLELAPRFDRARLHDGLYRIAIGLTKKVLIADVLGRLCVDPFYAAPERYAAPLHAVALYAFAFQIYGDFAGYSDVAIGTARLFGFDLPENFLGPYRARSVREFWRRWHVSLSTWVRDYVYVPLGGSRGSEARIARNLMVTMLVIAVWHGASVLWVIYGLLQGGVMVLERAAWRARGRRGFATTRARSLVAWAYAFHFTVAACFFIRAPGLEHVRLVFATSGDVAALPRAAWLALAAAALTHFLPTGWSERFQARMCALPTTVVGVLFGAVCGCVALALAGDTPFIYFQF